MPVNPTYPGLYIEEVPSANHSITPAPTSITVFVGYTHPFQGLCAERNTWGLATRIFSFRDYERLFGGLYRNPIVPSDVPDAVYQFFLNGGSDAYVVALQPRYVGVGRPAVNGQTGDRAGIRFTAKQLTSNSQKLSIAIRNIDVTRSIADIVISYGKTVEKFRGVTTVVGDPTTIVDPKFIANALASSTLVSVAPVAAQYAATYVAVATPTTVLALDIGDMTAGNVVVMSDFTDVFADDKPLDKIEIFNLLSIPAITDNLVWNVALAYCERKRAFFIMDPPANASADDTAPPGFTKIEDQLDLVPHYSSNGALYFPYLNTIDPITGLTRGEPPSGFVAGIFARTDMRRGVWKAPAGLEASIANTTGVVETGKMTDMRQGTVNAKGVNVLRSFPGSGTVVWGARTVGTSPALEPWRYVPVRRTALFIEQTLLRNLGWVVFEPNDAPLWTAMRISVENFMLSLFRQQAFEGSTPSQAFLVQCDSTTTTQEDIDLGRVNIVVGFRPLKPAEFVIIKITQLAGQAS